MSDPISRLNAALEGRYKVGREIGEGGMATVYLAEDVKHQRQVALKVLKPELAAVVGAERFLAEIQTTANLQHPHILPLHDSGEADTFLFYVMPYVDGESLREKLDREHQLPVDEAVGITVALAGALEHAHRKGIIHRDIKPANILLQDGQPVVADFGIALAVGAAGGARLTETGLSVGTPYYMSPEQATGDLGVGPASDTYALACVLYEMLVGEPPFPGATAQAVLGKIIAGEAVSATKLRPAIAPNVDAAIRRGLEKIPADRFTGAESFAKALRDPGFSYGQQADAPVGGASGGWKRVALAASAAAVVFGASAGWMAYTPDAPVPLTRYGIVLPDAHDPARFYGENVTIAPDGASIVYVGPGAQGSGQQLWLRRRDQLAPTPVSGTERALSPSFSPDGQRVAFLTQGPSAVKVVSLGGEPPLTLVDNGLGGNDVAWGPDGNVYFDLGSFGMARVPATGGPIDTVTVLDSARAETFHAWYDILPNGRGALMTVGYTPASRADDYTIALVDLETGEYSTLVQGVYGRYAPSGHLVYVSADGTLLAAPFDQNRLEITGPAVALAEGIGVGDFGSVDLAIAQDGTMAYMAGLASSGLARVVWVDRAGTVTPVDPDWEYDPGQPEIAVALSPDGSRLAVKIDTEAGEDIWIKQLDRGPLSRLTFETSIERRPRWSADGRSVLYTSDRKDGAGHYDLWKQPADGTGSPEILLDLEASILEVQMTPDESAFVLRLGGTSGTTGVRDLVSLRVGESETTPIAVEPYDEKAVALSPSGRWVAYESTETGRDEIFVRPYPNAQGGKWQVSVNGGINPKWAHSERELFFVNGAGEMVAVEVRLSEDGFGVGERRALFSTLDLVVDANTNYASWDVAADDQRFIMVQLGAGGGTPSELVVVQSFLADLKARVPR